MANLTTRKQYKITSWRDNSIKIVLVQGEGSSTDNPTYTKTITFQCYDSYGVLTIPATAEIVLAVERPDGETDLIAGSMIAGTNSDITFNIKNTITACTGIVRGEIRIITTDSIVKFYGINFNIYSGISDDGAIHSEQFDALIQALQKVINVTGDGEVATMDSVIAHGGTNPVASGIIYDYLSGNFYTKTESDNKYQTLANKTQTIDSDRQTTTANATQYPSVAAVKDFLYANFLTEQEIYDYLDSFYTQAEADNKFALKSNSYTKAEINAIQTENDKRFALHMSVAFDNNGVPVKFVSKNNLSAGDFAGDAIKIAFIGSNVQLIQSGAFIGCNNLTDVYVDKKISAITIQDGAIPAGVTVHYMDGFNYGELIIAAVKYLNTIKANAADVYTKSEIDNELSNQKPVIISYLLPAANWNNKEQTFDISNYYQLTTNTYVKLVMDESEITKLENCGAYSIELFGDDEKDSLMGVKISGEVPNEDVTIKIYLTETNYFEVQP